MEMTSSQHPPRYLHHNNYLIRNNLILSNTLLLSFIMFVLDNHIVASYDYVLVVGGVGRGFPAYNEEGAATGGGLSGPV